MIRLIKKHLYFLVAGYFRFFARIYLGRWNPKVIVITGSEGKTTLLHLVKSQLKDNAIYSERANSAFGIPFHILGLNRTTFHPFEWILLLLRAPFQIFRSIETKNIYVVEADCERPGEGKFLATLLRPDITLWVSSSRTHTAHFKESPTRSIEQAVAHEFGFFVRHTKDTVIANADNENIVKELQSSSAKQLVQVHYKEHLTHFAVDSNKTTFTIEGKNYTVQGLLPEESAGAIYMTLKLCEKLQVNIDPTFSHFVLAPGRGNVFKGIKNTTLIDSSYNAAPESMRAMLALFKKYPSEKKWIVLGDMIELGVVEEEEHEKIARAIVALAPDKIILIGPRLRLSTLPALIQAQVPKEKIEAFEKPLPAYLYIEEALQGGETILFKGARFLEGIIEKLLYNNQDASSLPRREVVWQERRKQWGL